MGNRVKKMKPGKLTGPSHKRGGILLEAEGGEYIIKKSSVKKIGKNKLDKINKEGKLPMARTIKGGNKYALTTKKDMPKRKAENIVKKGNRIRSGNKNALVAKKDMPKRKARNIVKGGNKNALTTKKDMPKKREQGGAINPPNTPKAGDSIKTYASGGYVEGK